MPRSSRRLAALFAAAACGAGATGCGGSSGDGGGGGSGGGGGGGEGGKIAFLLPESKTARYESQDKPRFLANVKRLCPKCEVLYANASQDAAKQQQQADSFLTQGAKVLVLDAVDVTSAASIANKARQTGVKVVSYGRLVAEAPLDYYVSIDPYKVGRQQADALLAALKAKGVTSPRVVMINGAPTDSNAAPYKRGALDVLKAAGAKVVREYDTPDWSPDKAQTQMSGAITALGKDGFDAVYVANDGMAGGAITAMRSAGVSSRERPVTGQDAEVAGLQRVVEGTQLMTVYQDIPKLAKAAAELAVPLAQGKAPPDIARDRTDNGAGEIPSVLIPTIAIDKKNMESVIFKDGFATAKQVCTEDFAEACAAAGLN